MSGSLLDTYIRALSHRQYSPHILALVLLHILTFSKIDPLHCAGAYHVKHVLE